MLITTANHLANIQGKTKTKDRWMIDDEKKRKNPFAQLSVYALEYIIQQNSPPNLIFSASSSVPSCRWTSLSSSGLARDLFCFVLPKELEKKKKRWGERKAKSYPSIGWAWPALFSLGYPFSEKESNDCPLGSASCASGLCIAFRGPLPSTHGRANSTSSRPVIYLLALGIEQKTSRPSDPPLFHSFLPHSSERTKSIFPD